MATHSLPDKKLKYIYNYNSDIFNKLIVFLKRIKYDFINLKILKSLIINPKVSEACFIQSYLVDQC